MNDISGHLENIVFMELLSRGYQVNIGKINELEVDFVAVKKDVRYYIQVAYLLSENRTIEREFSVLENIPDNYLKIVLSMDKIFDRSRNGILWYNLIDFPGNRTLKDTI